MGRLLSRALAAILVFTAFAAGVVVLLVVAFDMQIEFAGSGMRPIFSFGTPDAHFAALEADRGSRDPTTPSADPPARGEDAAPPESPATAATASADSADSAESGAYWTDFRGPHRDGL